MIRLLIVEDDPAVRQGLHMLFATEANVAVIGDVLVLDGVAAAELVTKLRPDVVLVDGDTRNTQGAAIAEALHAICQRVPVIVLSLHDDALARARAADAGAAAFVAKSMPADTLLETIQRVVQESGAGHSCPHLQPRDRRYTGINTMKEVTPESATRRRPDAPTPPHENTKGQTPWLTISS